MSGFMSGHGKSDIFHLSGVVRHVRATHTHSLQTPINPRFCSVVAALLNALSCVSGLSEPVIEPCSQYAFQSEVRTARTFAGVRRFAGGISPASSMAFLSRSSAVAALPVMRLASSVASLSRT